MKLVRRVSSLVTIGCKLVEQYTFTDKKVVGGLVAQAQWCGWIKRNKANSVSAFLSSWLRLSLANSMKCERRGWRSGGGTEVLIEDGKVLTDRKKMAHLYSWGDEYLIRTRIKKFWFLHFQRRFLTSWYILTSIRTLIKGWQIQTLEQEEIGV